MNGFKTPPVLFTVFNRPDLTARVFESIREARPERLFVAADGPRQDRAGEAEACEATRRVTEQIDWPCSCERLYRSGNLGCRTAMSQAIDWFFERVEEGIILEDDCIPEPGFFQYCAEMLERYREDPRIALISGCNFQPEESGKLPKASYYFSRYPHIWGWASWRRVWQSYDVALGKWTGDASSLSGVVESPLVRKHFAQMFDGVKTGKIDTWDFQLLFECLNSGRLAAIPWTNLVMNDGFDERATHTMSREGHVIERSFPMNFPLLHPLEVTVDEGADRHTEREVFKIRRRSLRSRLVSRLRKLRNSLTGR